VDRFHARVEVFLVSEKIATRRYRWRIKNNREWLEARAIIDVVTAEPRSGLGRLILTAHRYRAPRKYGFALTYMGVPVFRLDVDPGRGHTNIKDMVTVWGTHWQTWPSMDAEPDTRCMGHNRWFYAFLERAHIRYPYPYDPPPLGYQLDLLP
jgi:hypothetical protein